jgi:hypothetical protein
MALALFAGVLVILFDASVTRLIPLYAIGVFLSFTLSQVGMALRWWKSGRLQPGQEVAERSSVLHQDPKWAIKMAVNGFGALCTAVVTLVFGFTKFNDGAYIVVILIPIVVIAFTAIHRHYQGLAKRLSLESYHYLPRVVRQRVIVPISGVHQGSLAGLRYATSISDDVTAVYISMDPEEAQKIQSKWSVWGEGIRLVVLESPYRLLIEPIMDYVEGLRKIRQPNEVISVRVPQFAPRNWWSGILHNQTAFMLGLAVLLRPRVVIIEVPYQVD